MEIPSALSAPLRIKFKVYLSRHWADLIFSANTFENQVYKVGGYMSVCMLMRPIETHSAVVKSTHITSSPLDPLKLK